MELAALVSYLDGYLRVAEVPDAPHAVNGLQVANAGAVSRVAAAVDLCEATVRMAAEQGADFLLVHHGLFWRGLEPLAGRASRRAAISARNTACGSAGGERSTSLCTRSSASWRPSRALHRGCCRSARSGCAASGS